MIYQEFARHSKGIHTPVFGLNTLPLFSVERGWNWMRWVAKWCRWSGDKEDAGWADMSGQIRSWDTDYQSWIFIHFGSRVFAGLLFGLIAVWTADACVALALAHSLGFRFKFRFRFAFAIASAHAATATSICIRIRSGVGHCLPKTATQLSRPVGTTMPACWYGCYMVWYMVRV